MLTVPLGAQLSRIGATTLTFSAALRGTDTAFDPDNNVYLVVNAYGTTIGAFVSTTGAPLGAPFQISSTPEHAAYPRVVFYRTPGGAGRFLVVWHQGNGPNTVRARVVAFPGTVIGSEGVVSAGDPPTWSEEGPAVAYSPASQVFLVTWTNGSDVRARRVGLDAQPIGTVTSIAAGYGRDPGVAWNHATNQFGVSYNGADGGGALSAFALVGADGSLLRRNVFSRSSGTFISDVAFNPATGRWVMVWFSAEGSRAAEINSAGDVLALGPISSVVGWYDGLGISYNSVSGSFLAVGHYVGGPGGEIGAVELNRRGAKFSGDTIITATAPRIGSFYPRASGSWHAASWHVSFERDHANVYGQAVATSTTGGGSDTSLGGSPTSPPGPTPAPPPPPPTGGCTTPDPFAALGGGTCVNGGWLPPGSSGSGGGSNSGGCTTPDPFASMGGGTCVNGGWTSAAAVAGAAARHLAAARRPIRLPSMGGGTCVNGGWTSAAVAAVDIWRSVYRDRRRHLRERRLDSRRRLDLAAARHPIRLPQWVAAPA